MLRKLVNIGQNALKRKNLSVMVGKVQARLSEKTDSAVLEWYGAQAQNHEDFLRDIDFALWDETKAACDALSEQAEKKLAALPRDLGGGGNYELLYFLVRYMNARTVVETGVAAGWSSQAILTGLQKNGDGHLHSSDFPYFRMENPEQYIGFVVDEALKSHWTLHIEGDQHNLLKIADAVSQIDIFHYDSDKSYAGRERAYALMKDKLSPNAAVIFDDIQDNAHFKDFVENARQPFRIFGFGGKYVGLTGPFLEGREND